MTLQQTLARYNITLRSKDQDAWRAQESTKGSIPSIGIERCYLVATDGLMAWVVLGDFETPFYCHLANFEEEEKDEERGEAAPRHSKKSQNIDAAIALLGI